MNAVPAIVPHLAQLPKRYVEACAAIFRCEQVDECAEWANKAAAIASYAKQAKDETLKAVAARIQARAVRRMGELLGEVPSQVGINRGTDRSKTRSAVARKAGVSAFQQTTAMNVARIPKDDFERMVESTKPPALSTLAEVRRTRAVGKKRAKGALKIHRFARWCETTNAKPFVAVADAGDVRTIAAWCKEFLS